MKLPGGKEIKDKNLVIGGGVVAGAIVLMAWRKKKKAASAAAGSGTDAGGVDPNSIDPNTGLPYGEETGYGGYYMGTEIPNPYPSATGSPTVSGQTYTSNLAWEADAVQWATTYFGATAVLTASATGKYLSQDPHGLSTAEYALMSEIIGLIGMPPDGSFRLIQAAPSQSPGGSPPPAGDPNNHYVADGKTSLNGVASRFGSSPAKIITATTPSEPADVAAYLASSKGDYSRALRAGTKWNIPKT